MPSFSKILCPIDFSELSLQALDVASQTAQDLNAELSVLFVAVPGSELFDAADFDAIGFAPALAGDGAELDEPVVVAQKFLSQLIDARVPKSVNARGLVRVGNVREEIETVARKQHSDLIVIATKGLGGWRHLVFGSVMETAVHMGSCPVLALHGQPKDAQYQRVWPPRVILCPTDFSAPSREAFKQANELAKHYDAQLQLLYVTWTLSSRLPSGEYEISSYDRLKISKAHADLCEWIANNEPSSVRAHPLVRVGGKAEQIERAAEQEGADLIVMATHGMSGWDRLFYGSIAEEVMRSTKFPILIIHPPTD